MTHGELLARQLKGTREWTSKLLEDFRGDDWTFQPAPGLAHPLWLCGHLAFAQNALVHVRVLGTAGLLEPAFVEHFPIGGPVKSVSEHDYPPIERVLETMHALHKETLSAVGNMRDEVLNEPAFGGDGQPHPHYEDKRGAVEHCNRHEAFHAGQLALIRRLLGKSFLR